MAEAAPLLRLDAVTAGYGETVVLEKLTLAVAPGEAVSIVGRNGVGKTTLLATVMGHTQRHGGSIAFAGRPIATLPTWRRVRLGIGYVPQEREIFPSLSVTENLAVAARPGDWTAERVFALFPRLAERRDNAGNKLSGGEQQMLSIGRALMGNPRLLLMDEPTEGLAPVIVEQLQSAMAELLKSGGLTVVLVEQNSRVALAFAPRTIVMDRGRIAYDGPSAKLAAEPALLEKLIGVAG
jgi:branched-chain amino acid transport system ATP-binding protein